MQSPSNCHPSSFSGCFSNTTNETLRNGSLGLTGLEAVRTSVAAREEILLSTIEIVCTFSFGTQNSLAYYIVFPGDGWWASRSLAKSTSSRHIAFVALS